MSWAVLSPFGDSVHVVPWDDEKDEIAYGHHVAIGCWCVPSRVDPDKPLDHPIWNHHEPREPGSNDLVQ